MKERRITRICEIAVSYDCKRHNSCIWIWFFMSLLRQCSWRMKRISTEKSSPMSPTY